MYKVLRKLTEFGGILGSRSSVHTKEQTGDYIKEEVQGQGMVKKKSRKEPKTQSRPAVLSPASTAHMTWGCTVPACVLYGLNI